METIRIDIINPKVKAILNDLADLELIRIKKEAGEPEFKELLNKLRADSEKAPSVNEITAEVEAVRNARYEK